MIPETRSKIQGIGIASPQGRPLCIYIYKNKEYITLVAIYVDDLIVASNDEEKKSELKRELAKSFKMKDLGKLHYCLGIEFKEDIEKGTIRMSQKKYIQDLLNFNMQDCKPVTTPMNTAVKLTKEMQRKTEEEKRKMEGIPYRNLIGSLMYAATSTRPDIASR